MAYRGYKDAQGKKVPGVTTISGRTADKGGLLWWCNQIGLGTHESCEFQEPCKHCGRREGMTQRDALSLAADVGKYAHALIECRVQRQGLGSEMFTKYEHLDEEQVAQAAASLQAFDKWVAAYSLEFIETELELVSEKYKFGGRMDAIGRVGGRFALIDWKTSNGIYPDYLVQLAGYLILLEENGFPDVEEIHILRISKQNASHEHRVIPRASYQPAIEFFLLSKQVYDLDKGLKKLLK